MIYIHKQKKIKINFKILENVLNSVFYIVDLTQFMWNKFRNYVSLRKIYINWRFCSNTLDVFFYLFYPESSIFEIYPIPISKQIQNCIPSSESFFQIRLSSTPSTAYCFFLNKKNVLPLGLFKFSKERQSDYFCQVVCISLYNISQHTSYLKHLTHYAKLALKT